jgi:hypothetical protein
MMKRKVSIIAALALALSACVTGEPKIAFNPAEGAFINQHGTGKIEGWIFSRQSGGHVVTAAGNLITLIPVTKYSEYILGTLSEEDLHTGRALSKTPYENGEQSRITYAGDRGRFAFHRLSVGDYYIVGPVYTQLPRFPRGKGILARVSVSDNRTTRVVINPDY